MNREQKAAVVEEIAGQLEASEAVFAVDYRGITVAQVADLRGKLRDADAKLRVVKNSLSERAADQAGASELKPFLQGPTALAMVQGDVAVAAKALSDAARTLGILAFKGGTMNGATLSAEQIQSIARLPSRDVLNAQLVGTIAAPLTGLVRTLNALIAGIAIQLQAIVDLDPPVLVAGAAPAPPAEAPAAEAPVPPAEPEAPADEAPEAPADEAPEAPADEAPEAPADEALEAPADEAPEAPADEAPEAPADEAPEAPADEAPEAPADEAPEAPADEVPEAPAPEAPVDEAPAAEVPAAEAPAPEAPVDEAPPAEVPAAEPEAEAPAATEPEQPEGAASDAEPSDA